MIKKVLAILFATVLTLSLISCNYAEIQSNEPPLIEVKPPIEDNETPGEQPPIEENENPLEPPVEGNENPVDNETPEEYNKKVIDYLYHKNYLTESYHKINNNQKKLSSLNKNMKSTSITTLVSGDKISDQSMGFEYFRAYINYFKEYADNAKEKVNTYLPLVTELGVYQQFEDKNIYFKLISKSNDSFEDIHFYIMNIDEKEFIYLHSYIVNDIDILDISITHEGVFQEGLRDTVTYRKIGERTISIYDVVELTSEFRIKGKDIYPQIYEINIEDENNYHINVMSASSLIPDVEPGTVLDIEKSEYGLTQYIMKDNYLTQISLSNRVSSENSYHVIIYPIAGDFRTSIQLAYNNSLFLNGYFSARLFKNLESIEINNTNNILTVDKINTKEYTYDFSNIDKPYANSLKNGNNTNYSVSISLKQFGSVRRTFNEINKSELMVDIEDIVNNVNIDQISEGIKVLGIHFKQVDTYSWNKYFENGYIYGFEDQTIFDEKYLLEDIVKPTIYGTETIKKSDFLNMTSEDILKLVVAVDDIDGEIILDTNNYSLIYKDEEVTAIIFKTQDFSGNQIEYIVSVV